MKIKQALTASVVAAAITLSGCKPTVDKTHDRVQALTTAVQPGPDNVLAAQDYYDSRSDLVNITPDQRQSLVIGRAKLRRLQEGLQSGAISLKDFVSLVIGSNEQIITDENTKLKVIHNIGRPVADIAFGENEWEIWTDPSSPNRVLKNPHIISVDLKGGALTVEVEGDEFDLQAPDGKWDVLARTEGEEVETGKTTYTFEIGLVIADKPQILAGQ